MWLALTGTPGTGKTAVAQVLKKRGHSVVDLNSIVKLKGFVLERDKERETDVVDLDSVTRYLETELPHEETMIFEGHWSHNIQVTGAVVLRCDPRVLRTRLAEKGFSDAKIKENVEAELVDVILVEAVEGLGQDRVAEIDASDLDVEAVADIVEEVLNGDFNRYKVGSVDWSGQLMDR